MSGDLDLWEMSRGEINIKPKFSTWSCFLVFFFLFFLSCSCSLFSESCVLLLLFTSSLHFFLLDGFCLSFSLWLSRLSSFLLNPCPRSKEQILLDQCKDGEIVGTCKCLLAIFARIEKTIVFKRLLSVQPNPWPSSALLYLPSSQIIAEGWSWNEGRNARPKSLVRKTKQMRGVENEDFKGDYQWWVNARK